MTVFPGIDDGVPTRVAAASAYAPTSQYDQPQWPKWGEHYETKGRAGEAPDLPEARRAARALRGVEADRGRRRADRIWPEMLRLYAGQCYTIGTVAGVLQPIAARKGLRNLPEKGVFNWEPQAQFGVYLPDTFWYGP